MDEVVEKVGAPEEPVNIAVVAAEVAVPSPRADVFRFSFRRVQRIYDEKNPALVLHTIPRSDELTDCAVGSDSQDAAKKIHAVYGEDIEFSGGSVVASAVLV